ncbi:hypothetical protein G5C51_04645 [Streptomyces sp. A7024]|uniref:Replication-relaxation n=1 Tax=Streptomyces coryli TaxID=1128680 RepID=A0A6G4TVX7_9ACTN|nr:replication-relaxation family protein [Streptomyces coryli]NGN63197.1 hypothetical protein [Streptomyces coryli]
MPYPHPAPLGASRLGQQALEVLYQHRLVSTRQLHRLLTPTHANADYLRKQLHRLRARDMVDRVGRRANGQSELLWWVTDAGAAAIEAAGQLSVRPYRMNETAAFGPLQEHTLALNETGLCFVEWARRRDDECHPLDWTPELAHRLRDGETRPGDEAFLVPDSVLRYVHTGSGPGGQRRLLTFFVELDRATMSVARLADKVRNYDRYRSYVPAPPPGLSGRKNPSGRPAWKDRYPAFPRLLIVLTGASEQRLQRRTDDLRSLVNADPKLARSPLRAGVTSLQQLAKAGPFAPIFTPLLGAPTGLDAFLTPPAASTSAA